MLDKKINDKRGQTGETITWLVATVVIVVVLLISIFVASAFFGDNKKILSIGNADYLAISSLFSYALTKDSGGNLIYNKIKDDGNLNDFNGNLALDIFRKFYADSTTEVWVGLVSEGTLLPYNSNDYFGSGPTVVTALDSSNKSPIVGGRSIYFYNGRIILNDDKGLAVLIKYFK